MRYDETLSTSLSLLNHARQREQAAWKELVRIYGPLVLEWCRQQGVRGSDAEDIVQEVFLAVANHLDRFGERSGKKNFRGWLWTIVRSKVMDHLRRQRRIPLTVADSICDHACDGDNWNTEERSSLDAHRDIAVLVSRSLIHIQQDFSEQTWSAFWRITVLGESPSSVAQDMKMTPAAVCMCRSRVLRRLREVLPDCP
ncbi:MAG: sigma-70 family RNA polymerase sigma factor [Pirellula sp.]|jgi:RNA polymerase sigma-70 factor (ECF subfamily)|nr:sigma-70 family RNA polymerase sigma factor [Pirellula sp.]